LRWLFAIPIVFSCVGCSSGGDAQLLVDIRTDLQSGIDFVDIRTRVIRADDSGLEREVLVPAPAARDLSTGFRIAEILELEEGPKRVEVALLDAMTMVVADRTMSIDLMGTGAVVASVTRTCLGVVCPGAADAPGQSECLGGSCVTPECAQGVADACDTPSLSLAELMRRSVDATCEMVRTCGGPVEELLFRGNGCEADLARRYNDFATVPLTASLAEGRIIYHGEKAFGCLNALGRDCRTFAMGKDHLECVEAIEGTIALGESCNNDFECVGVGSACRIDLACPGTCVQRLDVGAPCEIDDQCRTTLSCEGGVCSDHVPDGEPCLPGEDQCRFSAVCTDLGSGVNLCRPISDLFGATEGEPCGEVVLQYCELGLGCTTEPSDRRCVPKVPSGEACAPAYPDLCPAQEYCDPSTLRCTLLPVNLAPCLMLDGEPRCGSGSECDRTSGTCVTWKDVGEACTVDAECSFGLCPAGRCPGACM